MEEIKVSIIMPTYNHADTIKRAIDSVIEQSYKDYELLIIDNGSKDNTKEICEKYLSSKIRYIYTDIPNVSIARNKGIEESKGKFIVFLDSDDFFEKDYLSEMINGIEKENFDWFSCGCRELNSKKLRLLGEKEIDLVNNTEDTKIYLEILKEKYLFNELWNKVYLKKIIQDNEIKFDSNYNLGEDFLFNLEYISNVKKVGYINKALYVYRDSETGLKEKHRENKFDIEYELTKRLEELYDKKSFDKSYIYNRYARVYYNEVLKICNIDKDDDKLKKFLENEKTKKDIKLLSEKVSDFKFKIFVKVFLKNGVSGAKKFSRIVRIVKRTK